METPEELKAVLMAEAGMGHKPGQSGPVLVFTKVTRGAETRSLVAGNKE